MTDSLTFFAQIDSSAGALSGTPLVIQNSTDPTVPYSIVRGGIGSGSSSMRKVVVESPFVQGRNVVHFVPGSGAVTLQIRVRGSTFDWLDYYTSQLLTYLTSAKFHLTLTINGTTHVWTYEEVDNWIVGDPQSPNLGNWDDVSLRSFTQIVTAQTMREPGVVSGRY